MARFATPRVVVSRCLGFARCRWNGLTISDHFVDRLRGHVTFCPVCPEVRIGLGVPRDPIRVIRGEDGPRLYQPATERDVSAEMAAFTSEFLEAAGPVDGFLLKSRSPSCGLKDVKVYGSALLGAQTVGRAAGRFAGPVLERLGHLAIEDEGRLNNFILREHWLTKLYALAAFRELRSGCEAAGDWGLGPLVEFHARSKWLLMAHSEVVAREMGRLVANHDGGPGREVYEAYGEALARALSRPAKFQANVNVLMHMLGHVSDGLSGAEKALFLDTLEKYRAGQVPLSVPVALVRSWALRFGREKLLTQTFLEPYPEALVEITDSGKGRGA